MSKNYDSSKDDSDNEFMRFIDECKDATIEDLDRLLEYKLSSEIQISTTLFVAFIAIAGMIVAIIIDSALQLAGIVITLTSTGLLSALFIIIIENN